MKKLLVMLLAVSMVLSMTFALAACGGDDNTDTSSKPAETSKEDSKVDASEGSSADASEDSAVGTSEEPSVDSTEEPSVDSTEDPSVDSTEDPSVDSTEDPSSSAPVTGPIDYKTTATKTNYALGKTYTLSRDTTQIEPEYLYLAYDSGVKDWSDEELKKMTDGNIGDIASETYATPSIAALAGVTVQLVGTNKLFEYVIDLGDYYGDINSIKFRNVRDGIDNGANRGFKVRLVYVSDDGATWTKVAGVESKTQVDGAPEFKNSKDETLTAIEHYDFTYTLNEAAKGKFVRMILVSNGGYVIQLEEIEIWN